MLAHAPRPLTAVTEEEAERIRAALSQHDLELSEAGLGPQPGARPLTLDDWIALQEHLPELRAELLHGRIVCMGFAAPEHEALVGAATVQLGAQLRGTPCRPYGSNLAIEAGESYVNADVAIICGPVERHPERPSIVRNPSVVVEVTSPRTEARDRGEKLDAYQATASLRAVLVVARERPYVVLYTRAGPADDWVMRSARAGRLELGVENLHLDVDALYADAAEP